VVRQSRDNELKAVLTAEQYDKMLALRKEKKAEQQEKATEEKKPHNE
jgi:Spy/CpxP family protein refolding chaperone